MSEPMEKCDNCLKQFPQSKIATHFGYCRRNIKRCDQCGQLYDINNKEQHQQQFHKKVPCKYCKKQLSAVQLEIHQKACTRRTKYCEYCELNVPINQYDIHLRACQARTKQCQKCMKSVTNKEYFVHAATCQGSPRKYNSGGSSGSGGSSNTYNSDNSNSSSNSYQQYLKNQEKKMRNYGDINSRNNRQESDELDYGKIYGNGRAKVDQQKSRNQKRQIQSRNGIKNTGSSSNSQPYSKASSTNKNSNPINNPIKKQYSNNYMKNQMKQQKYEDKYRINVPHKPQIRKIQQNIPTYGIKRPIKQSKKQQPSQKYNPSSKNPTFNKKQHIPIFDPKQYGGYQQQDDISQQMLQQSYGIRNQNNRLQQFDESQQIQKAIFQSMQQKQKKISYDNIPKQLQSQQLMRSSFSKDFDIEKQKAIYQQLQRNNAKKKKR